MRKIICATVVLVFILAWAVDGLIVAAIISAAYAWGARQVSKWHADENLR